MFTAAARRLVQALALTTALWASPARAADFGIGLFGGASLPVNQADEENGNIFGARFPVSLLGLVTVEPYFATSRQKDVIRTVGGMQVPDPGWEGSLFGANLILGSPLRVGLIFFPYAGINSARLIRVGGERISGTGVDIGAGVGIAPSRHMSMVLRAEANSISAGGSTRRFGYLTFGLNYRLDRID